ncbi:MAG: NAD-glutamate dehydrogenase [Leptospiraceae bacterium]|nr:NAD-glutamate dehydrogenase [Leptospiraceae bacterium]
MQIHPDLSHQFKELYEFYIPASYRSFLTPADLDNFMEQRLGFVAQRSSLIQVRAFNPADDQYWLAGKSIIEVNQPDCRFIVDVLIEYLNSAGLPIEQVIHPVLPLERDQAGCLLAFTGNSYESLVYIEIPRQSTDRLQQVESDLQEQVRELQLITGDYADGLQILQQVPMSAAALEYKDWLLEFMILMGSARITKTGTVESAYGILKIEKQLAVIQQNLQDTERRQDLVNGWQILESTLFSSVNRSRLYYAAILPGTQTDLLLIGLFAQKAELMDRSLVPHISGQLRDFIERSRVLPASFTAKEILSIAGRVPLGILYTRPDLAPEIYSFFINNLYAREPEFVVCPDRSHRMYWILATVPMREKLDDIRNRLIEVLGSRQEQMLYYTQDKLNKNRLLILGIQTPLQLETEILEKLQHDLAPVFHTWTVEFRRLVHNKHTGLDFINQSLERYFAGMGADFQIRQSPYESLLDLDQLEALTPERSIRVRCIRRADQSIVKIYSLHEIALSRTIPLLENFGLQVQSEYSIDYRYAGQNRIVSSYTIQDDAISDKNDRERLSRALQLVIRGEATSNRLDRLVVTAGLDSRQLKLLKALGAWYFQVDKGYSRKTLFETLLKYPDYCRLLLTAFSERHNPAQNQSEGEGDAVIQQMIASMPGLQEATMCRRLHLFCQAIVRTDYFLNQSEISFKIQSYRLEFLPLPRPFAEIFVFDYDMEGVHLRGGPVARGGLRWSDRMDDYRVEVLGLMKAQMVKNTVIVPVGSKGGFVLKQGAFPDRAAWIAAGKAAYQRYIRCLLRLTDNYDAEWRVHPPAGIQRLDGDDPYLVVAADKGTATFSDLANAVSVEQHFWLHDAFASGGSRGYDHKVQGITAKGAWESVRRHCLEAGLDPDKGAIRVVGIGDMSGDVFGNGMLLSKSMALIAAFNHLYIFIDPNPDSPTAWQERQRLFTAGLNWDQYNCALISTGGGIFDRNARSIELSAEARQALGITAEQLSGEDTIKAILQAPVDLLWNGGIGTYFKSAQETHFDAQDSLNDRVRINGNQIRAKVVGEGGNLGFTQAARIEAALNQVRLNTDAIDNSAGVDMSDHEVNLKILLGSLERKGIIKNEEERIQWIRRIEKQEIEKVLAHNSANNLGLSLEEIRRGDQMLYFRECIRDLVREGWIQREQDHMPYDSDLEPGANPALLLPRPVLASLMGFQKLYIKDVLQKERTFYGSDYNHYLRAYFPQELTQAFEESILEHPLRGELITTRIVNTIINSAGIAFFARCRLHTGKSGADIARAWLACADWIQLTELEVQLDDSQIPVAIQYEYRHLIQERLFLACCDVLKGLIAFPQTMASSVPLLRKIAMHSTYTSSAAHRKVMRNLDKVVQKRILEALRIADCVHLAFRIAQFQNAQPQISDPVHGFFQIWRSGKLDELAEILQSFHPHSSWELRFHSRLQDRVSGLPFELMLLTDDSAAKALAKLVGLAGDARTLHSRNELELAVLYEMLSDLDSVLERG